MGKQGKNGPQDTAMHVGKAIFAALTHQEIADLLNNLFKALPPGSHQQVLDQLSADTRHTLEQILASPNAVGEISKTDDMPVSPAKQAETWASLWDQWDDIVTEAAQEESDYILQDEHWEPPYFDEYGLVEDLETVAAKMLPLVQIAYENRFDPDDGFGLAIQDTENEIAGALPEWIEIVNGFDLPRSLTLCFLTWEKLLADEEGEDAFGFVQRVRLWEEEFAYSSLDRDSVVEFLSELPESDNRSILEGLTANKNVTLWKGSLSNTYSHWHGIYMYYLDRYAPERYLNNLRADIPQQWRAGLPLLEDLLQRREFDESVAVANEMIKSMLRFGYQSKAWTPESTLLVSVLADYYNIDTDWTNHKTLLRGYQQAAQELGHSELVNALNVQLAALDHAFDWEKMLTVFEETSLNADHRDALFQSWRDHIAQAAKPVDYASYGYDGYGLDREKQVDTWWVHWLLDSYYEPSKGMTWFQQQMDEWLATLGSKQATLDRDHGVLRLLTAELAAIGRIKRDSFPRFFQFVVRPKELATKDSPSRQAYLSQSITDNLGIRVMAYWHRHLRDLTPDPKLAHKSDYTNHARWMAALQETNIEAYQALLNEWRVEHQRRRNLWKAMDEMQLR